MEDPAKIEIELEETKHNLKRAKEESMQVMNSLSSLKEELERTRQELQKLKVDPEGAVKTMDLEYAAAGHALDLGAELDEGIA